MYITFRMSFIRLNLYTFNFDTMINEKQNAVEKTIELDGYQEY